MSGITAGTIALAAATTIGGALIQKMMAPKPSSSTPPAAPQSNDKQNAMRADQASTQAKARAAAAGASSSTRLTGPGGLGELDDKNKDTTTVLGY